MMNPINPVTGQAETNGVPRHESRAASSVAESSGLDSAGRERTLVVCRGVAAPRRLHPFWRYYGGKWRAAPRYPAPRHETIIEPFAGSAGYAMRYPDRRVILVERYAVVAEMWRYLISVSPSEVLRIPLVEHVDDLPSWVPAGGRYLVGFAMNAAVPSPRKTLSAGRVRLRAMGRKYEGWSECQRERVASQVGDIRHWQIIEGDYSSAPDVEATWFVDPPYNNKAGRHYVHNTLDYVALGDWCRALRGQAIVCENEGASWLPFEPFATFKAGVNGQGSREVVWLGGDSCHQPGGATKEAVT